MLARTFDRLRALYSDSSQHRLFSTSCLPDNRRIHLHTRRIASDATSGIARDTLHLRQFSHRTNVLTDSTSNGLPYRCNCTVRILHKPHMCAGVSSRSRMSLSIQIGLTVQWRLLHSPFGICCASGTRVSRFDFKALSSSNSLNWFDQFKL